MHKLHIFYFSLCILFTASINVAFSGSLDDEKLKELKDRSMETHYRPESEPTIDGNLDDEFWQSIEAEEQHFVEFQPNNGELSSQKTIVKTAYTDFGLYVSATLIDSSEEGVKTELGIRDDDGRNTDQFGLIIDTYNKGQNAFYFKVSAAGVQTDIFINRGRFDYNWDAVWNSEVQLTDQGWQVEIEIPYSAIRFSQADEQTWGLNFMRKIQRLNEVSYWSYVDNSIDGLVNQSGSLRGLKDIKPPLRLSISPYITAYYNQQAGESSSRITGGMDLKYGLTESFTLDMTLIPDFGQVQSDNLVYNLSPFEVRYAENRPFFTEGTELFNRGGLFYSRRVGQSFGNPSIEETDSLITLPSEAPLLNASKITGRTHNGTGLGFFNAVTNRTYAEYYDEETGTIRKTQVDDLTNFNVLVVDQNLKNNSSVSLINTNVQRLDGGADANVTGTDFVLQDKSNTYRIAGFGAYNYISDSTGKLSDGYKYSLAFAKISGNHQFELGRNVESDTYNPNDLGFLRNNNEVTHYANYRYVQFQPQGIFNRYRYFIGGNYSQLYKPSVYQNFSISNDFWAQLRNFHSFSINFSTRPTKTFDYFEPRAEGFKYYRTWNYSTRINYSTDNRKALMTRFSAGMWNAPDRNQFDYWVNISPRYRVSNQLSIGYSLNFNKQFSSIGFAEHLMDQNDQVGQVIFGERDIDVMSNVLNFNYTINNKMGFNFRMRHYWSKVNYFNYFNLENDGDVRNIAFSGKENEADLNEKHDTNYNAFNIDAVYSWQIAPGSFVNIVWKDAVQEVNQQVDANFSENLNNVLSSTHNQNLSVRLIYFLDYAQVRRKLNDNRS